jgi:two-component system, sensor histidine kinase SagS
VPVGPRILFVEGAPAPSKEASQTWPPAGEVQGVPSWSSALALLDREGFDRLLVRIDDENLRNELVARLRAAGILEQIPVAVAILDGAMKVLWANQNFLDWCQGAPMIVGAAFDDALGISSKDGHIVSTVATDLLPSPFQVDCRNDRRVEWRIQPLREEAQVASRFVAVGRDITAESQQQKRLEALHQAGNELAALTPEQLSEMCVEERVESLKLDIRRLTRDFLHYDVIEIRLLDPKTARLEPLLEEGMTSGATDRSLFAHLTGNGITGYVAASGKSYLCPDTSADPLYVPGAEGARSSVTAPLLFQDEIIGTLNVESPRLNAFSQDDVKFIEIFGREIAAALHTLQLLSAEKRTSASQSIEAVNREVAMPVDEILGTATTVLDRYIGHDAEMVEKLKRILSAARTIKQSIQKIGEDLTASPAGGKTAVPPPPPIKGMRILVVDNDERVRRSAHGILGRFGCIVETARDGQEALTMARLGTYDCILADIRLSDIGGYEIYCRIKQTQPQAKVILMSSYGYDPSHAIVKARQDGLKNILFKPFRVDQLLDALTCSTGAQRNPKLGA